MARLKKPEDMALQWLAIWKGYGLSTQLVRELLAALLLLRWFDYVEAEQEAMAVFEDRTHEPFLPPRLRWRHILRSGPDELHKSLEDIRDLAEDLRGRGEQLTTAHMRALAEPLHDILRIRPEHTFEFARRLDELPFETLGDRLALLALFDRLLEDSAERHDGEHASPDSVSRLVVTLANPRPGERVYDPCFGFGRFLVDAWHRAANMPGERRSRGPLLEVAGIEQSSSIFLIGLVRMLLAGISSPRLEIGDALEREPPGSPSRQGYDLVLADPPFGVKVGTRYSRDPWIYQHFPVATTDSVGLFVQHALMQLRPNGRAIVVVPEGFLFRGGAERELRRHLIEAGHVEAVVGLPPLAYAPYSSVKCSLLVLTKRSGSSHIRFADAEPVFETHRRAPSHINVRLAEGLADALRRPDLESPISETGVILGDKEHTDAVLSSIVWDVSATELAQTDWDLTPRRREKGGLQDLLVELREAAGESSAIVSLSGVAEVISGRSIKSSHLTDEPIGEVAVPFLRIKDISSGRVGSGSSWLAPEIAEDERRWALRSGDVIVSRSGTIGKAALVREDEAGSVAASGLFVLRPDTERLDPAFLLAYLEATACKNWLTARSRGTAIQHLNRSILQELPIPLPPLGLQRRATAEHRRFGTDVLQFLTREASGESPDRLTIWLGELLKRVPTLGASERMPSIELVDQIADMVTPASEWIERQTVPGPTLRWLEPLINALRPLSGLSQVPAGPGLLSILHDAERGFQKVLDYAGPSGSRDADVRIIAERMRAWMRAASQKLADSVLINVNPTQSELAVGTFSEFSLEIANEGSLPLRNFEISTTPPWGATRLAYFPEKSSVMLPVSGVVPSVLGTMSIQIVWAALNLNGARVGGQVELSLAIAEGARTTTRANLELGPSPYVTGSPLDPKHGHSLFFGRDMIIQNVARQISAQGNVVLLEGNRRAGKTSILKHLEGKSAIPGWLAVYSSLQGAEGAKDAVGVPTVEVFRSMAGSIASAVSRQGMEVPLPNGTTIPKGKPALGIAKACREGISPDSPFEDFREYLQIVLDVLQPANLGILLMLDEFDKLQEGIDNHVTSPQVPENIRYLIQNVPRFSAILTGSRRLKRLREEYWSALYGLGTSLQVTALDVASARKVVTEPVAGRLTYSNEAVEKILEATARQPYLIQCLCGRIFDDSVQTKSRSITLGKVESIATSLVRDFEHFASVWDYASRGPETGRQRRQLVLCLLADAYGQRAPIPFAELSEQLDQIGVEVSADALDVDLSHLRELELVDFVDGSYRLAVPLMAEWIGQHKDMDAIVAHARAEAEDEDV